MKLISAFLALSLLLDIGVVDSISWRPKPPLSGVVMRDFVNSRALPNVNPVRGGGGGGTSGSTTTTGTPTTTTSSTTTIEANNNNGIAEDVARGGHASVKTVKEEENEEARGEVKSDQDETVETAVAGEATATPTPTATTPQEETTEQEPAFQSVDVDLKMGKKEAKAAKEARRKASSAAKIAKKLKNRNHTNVRRKVMHANFGLTFGIMNWILPKNIFVPACAVISGVTLVVELLRYRPEYQWMNELSYSLVGSSIRKHEMEGNFTGILYFFMGVTLTSALFAKPCATLGIFQLALADPSASYFGTKTKHVYWSRIEGGLGGFGRNKGILGFLGGALFCMPFNYRVLSICKWGVNPPARATLAKASLALGLAGAFADLAVPSPVMTLPKRILGRRVPPFHIDDNFVVPIFSAFAAEKVFGALGFPLDLEMAKFVWF